MNRKHFLIKLTFIVQYWNNCSFQLSDSKYTMYLFTSAEKIHLPTILNGDFKCVVRKTMLTFYMNSCFYNKSNNLLFTIEITNYFCHKYLKKLFYVGKDKCIKNVVVSKRMNYFFILKPFLNLVCLHLTTDFISLYIERIIVTATI